jgi:hypothetical protein
MTYNYDGKALINRLEGTALLAAYVAYFSYVIIENV